MIDIGKFMETKRLLASKTYSHRRIAAMVGVCRATVSAIARGKRKNREREIEQHAPMPSGPLVRCPGCGGKVQLPCLACRADRRRERDNDLLRELRRKAQVQRLRALLRAVRRAYWEREARESELTDAVDYSPPEAPAGAGPSPCKYENRSRTSCGCNTSNSRSGMSDCSDG